ncbi:MAG: FtsK/SpoIIIE domain-containing protein [Oligoflexales bacterium]
MTTEKRDVLQDFLSYPKSSKDRNQADKSAMQVSHESAVLWAMGCWHLWRWRKRYAVFFIALAIASGLSGWFALHLRLLHEMAPEIFIPRVVRWFYQFFWWQHGIVVFTLMLSGWALILGFLMRYRHTFYGRKFEEAGLSTKSGRTPAPLFIDSLGHSRTRILLDGQGVPKTRFDEKKEDIEAIFDKKIESIKVGKKPSRIELIFTEQSLPDSITYDEIKKASSLAPYSFYVGMATEGPIVQCISDLPHMLITGSTGNGKSVFFKQALMGLLESSPHLQMYLIDLKNGLEMADFAQAPNVRIAKTMEDAVRTLKLLKTEMQRRFKYLEANGYKEIVPTRDKMDRIVVAVDEASVLYMKRNRYDPEYKIALEARALADNLAKLSRAASINLILATQKLSSEVLPTSVTENIAGRMCFRTESLHGSLLVLGNKDATSLSDIRGRGIWATGNRQTIVQAPYASETLAQDYSKAIAAEFKTGTRKCFGSMLGREQMKQINKTSVIVDGIIERMS